MKIFNGFQKVAEPFFDILHRFQNIYVFENNTIHIYIFFDFTIIRTINKYLNLENEKKNLNNKVFCPQIMNPNYRNYIKITVLTT